MSNPESFAHTHAAGHVIGGGRYSLHVTLSDSNLVWLAQDEVEQRLAVVRFFPAELRGDQRAWDVVKGRFANLLQVNHPRISRALEWYEAEGVEPFVAFEYVEGQGIAHRDAAIPWTKLEPVAVQIAEAISELHSHGVVHHCIEPANIIITESGAKLINAVVTGALKDPLLCPSSLQRSFGMHCASPQQVSGALPAPSDDYYSFAATLFELLSGAPLFPSAKSLNSDLRSGPPANLMTRLGAVPGLPPELAEFLLACLGKDPAQRPTSMPRLLRPPSPALQPGNTSPVRDSAPIATPVSAELEVLPENTTPMSLREPARARRKAPALVAAVVLLCGLAAGATWYLSNGKAEAERLAAAHDQKAREVEQLRELAEEQRQHAALLEQKKQQETEARQRAEAELKLREAEAASGAAEENEHQAVQASVEPAPVPAPTLPVAQPLGRSSNDDGFITLFNGRDLSGWEGDPSLWSAVDGCITAQLPPNAPTRKRWYLTWKSGSVDDFELHFSYRLRLLRGNKQPNGGVVYRAVTNNTPELSSYQFDVVADAKNAGAVNEDKKRYRICGYGESAVAAANEKTQVIGQVGDTNKLNAMRPEDWSNAVIVARGNRITHYLNGEVVADLADENKKRLHKSGLLALELYSRNTNNPGTFMQFRDIKLKRLEKSSGLVSAKSSEKR